MVNHTPPEESGTQRERAGFKQRIKSLGFQALPFAVGLVLYILLGILLWLALDLYIKPGDDSTKKKDLIQALSLIMAGVAGVIGIYFTWRGQRLSQRAQEENQRNTQAQLRNAQEQLRNAQEELSLTREGQITERFTRAIDQLGNGSLEIKLGGIYALERIARDSPERDYGTVMKVLAAYVREKARWTAETRSVSSLPSTEASDQNGGTDQYKEPSLHLPPTDIQSILDVFTQLEGNRLAHLERVEPNPFVFTHQPPRETDPGEKQLLANRLEEAMHLDLRGTDLRGANLREAHLEGADLSGAHLERADLMYAHLEGATLSGAHLEGANLSSAHLERALFHTAHVAALNQKSLRAVDFVEAHLEGANLSGAHLEGADLMYAHLKEADLSGAYLRGAILLGAYMKSATLSGADLQWAGLSEADLQSANVGKSQPKVEQPFALHFQGANLSEAIGLTQQQIDMAHGDETTQLPEDLDHPEHWSKSTKEQPNEEE